MEVKEHCLEKVNRLAILNSSFYIVLQVGAQHVSNKSSFPFSFCIIMTGVFELTLKGAFDQFFCVQEESVETTFLQMSKHM